MDIYEQIIKLVFIMKKNMAYYNIMEIQKYFCVYCDFADNNLYNLKCHLATKKHINISNNDTQIKNYTKTVYKCIECHKIYKNKSGFYKHAKLKHNVSEKQPIKISTTDKKLINEKNDNDGIGNLAYDIAINLGKDKLIDYLKQIDQLKESKNEEIKDIYKIKDEEIKNIYKTENDFHKKVVETSGQLIGRSMNMLNYAMQHFKETPKLISLDKTSARELLKYESRDGQITRKIENDKLPERIAKLNEMALLPKHIGNNIVAHYKKDDQTQQSLWVTDASRAKFIVRDNEWKKDDKGIKINKDIIVPILDEVVTVMNEYRKDHHNKIGHMTPEEEGKYVDIMTQSHNIQSDVNKGKTSKEIIKYIIPYFSMNRKSKN
jgi:hypothetical protein